MAPAEWGLRVGAGCGWGALRSGQVSAVRTGETACAERTAEHVRGFRLSPYTLEKVHGFNFVAVKPIS